MTLEPSLIPRADICFYDFHNLRENWFLFLDRSLCRRSNTAPALDMVFWCEPLFRWMVKPLTRSPNDDDEDGDDDKLDEEDDEDDDDEGVSVVRRVERGNLLSDLNQL